ncbi:alanine racemase [Namhaeicola litoreus]|uniref:Alanine racemase n=1 Tax=Namhaeicola litoreus TaxID=1052145 RepID=A0ABW3Y3W3_9FLAO
MKTSVSCPTLVLDVDRCKRNIQRMAKKAKESKVIFRPHFKTHQSLEIGKWFKEVGVNCITVSSLRMAQYFSEEWDDITVAFPVNLREIDLINDLATKIHLTLLVESVETVQFLNNQLLDKVGCFVKIDTGYHRTGIPVSKIELLDDLLNCISASDKIQFKGFLTHTGHTYSCRSKEEIESIYMVAVNELSGLKKRYLNRFPNLILSFGDTPSCSVLDDFSAFDEIRPGNFVFYDVTQCLIGSCESKDVAVALACPVVAIHKDRNEIVIYGGGIHLSKDRIEENSQLIFGKIVKNSGLKWGDEIDGMFVKSLSQEHGIVYCPERIIDDFNVGDLIYVLPIHSCMTIDLMKKYLTTKNDWVSCMKLEQ